MTPADQAIADAIRDTDGGPELFGAAGIYLSRRDLPAAALSAAICADRVVGEHPELGMGAVELRDFLLDVLARADRDREYRATLN